MQNLQNLVRLAQETSSEKRRALLEGVSDLFLGDGPGLQPHEQELAGEILERIVGDVEQQYRAELSERFADLSNAPHAFIKKLAADVIDVAGPVLRRSGVLSDTDLVEIVRAQGPDHQVAVAERPVVSETVSAALVNHADDRALVSLARNTGAEISRHSMEQFVARSEHSEVLHEPLLSRADLPEDLVHEMFWWVSSVLKREILTRVDVPEDKLDQAFAEANAQFVTRSTEDETGVSQVERQIRRMVRFGQLTPNSLVEFLSQGLVPEFIAALAHLAEIDMDTSRRIMFSQGAEALAVACRAAEFDHETFANIVRLLVQNGGLGGEVFHPAEFAELIELYKQMPSQNAKRAMRFWRIRKQSLDGASAA